MYDFLISEAGSKRRPERSPGPPKLCHAEIGRCAGHRPRRCRGKCLRHSHGYFGIHELCALKTSKPCNVHRWQFPSPLHATRTHTTGGHATTRFLEGFLEGSLKEMLLRRVLRRHLVSVSVGTGVLRRFLRRRCVIEGA